ncbi:hypothetical protein F4X73_15375 [Candidatus Poribacteria bacterium]|nr:hypothetical protein [Candidatus Poribacteria bacterium]
MYNRLPIVIAVLLVLFTTNGMSSKEKGHLYFPSSSKMIWVYEDQDGNELTRQVAESKLDDGKMYAGFKAEPVLKESRDFTRFLHPAYCHFGEDFVYLLVGEGLRKAIKARLTDEMELFSKLSVNSLKKNLPPDNNIKVDLDYKIKVDPIEPLKLLHKQIDVDNEWKALEINAKIVMKFNIEGIEIFKDAEDLPTTILDFAIVEKAKVVGTESIETPAGTFHECLKIVYKTDTKMTETRPIASADLPGESVTTIWFAPHVGIIKIHSETEKMFLHALRERELVKKHASDEEVTAITKPTVKTLQLKKYKIITDKEQNKQ